MRLVRRYPKSSAWLSTAKFAPIISVWRHIAVHFLSAEEVCLHRPHRQLSWRSGRVYAVHSRRSPPSESPQVNLGKVDLLTRTSARFRFWDSSWMLGQSMRWGGSTSAVSRDDRRRSAGSSWRGWLVVRYSGCWGVKTTGERGGRCSAMKWLLTSLVTGKAWSTVRVVRKGNEGCMEHTPNEDKHSTEAVEYSRWRTKFPSR